MTKSANFDVVMIGHFAKDDLVVDGQRERARGGGVYYGGIALARLGRRVAVVTRLHPDDFHLLDELREEGIEVHAVAARETSGIENTYCSADMERRECRLLGFAGQYRLDEIPDWTTQIYLACPIIAGEFDLTLVQALAQRAPLALDVQGFVRGHEGDRLVFQPWPEMARGLAHVTYLKVDLAEAEHLTGETDPVVAARILAAYGPQEVILTQSTGVTVLTKSGLHVGRFRPRSLEGRTGRGDTCFATYLGARLKDPPERAVQIAAAITTRKQERPGPWRDTLDELAPWLAD